MSELLQDTKLSYYKTWPITDNWLLTSDIFKNKTKELKYLYRNYTKDTKLYKTSPFRLLLTTDFWLLTSLKTKQNYRNILSVWN